MKLLDKFTYVKETKIDGVAVSVNIPVLLAYIGVPDPWYKDTVSLVYGFVNCAQPIHWSSDLRDPKYGIYEPYMFLDDLAIERCIDNGVLIPENILHDANIDIIYRR